MSIERFGVSVESKLLQKFDMLIKSKGYTTRSEAIRDLMREEIVESDAELENAEGFGSLTLVYDHDAGDVVEKLLHIQHEFHDHIISTTHIHIDAEHCMEMIALRGKISEIKKIGDRLRALKGVLYGKLVVAKSMSR
jgi:CopG family nickel-responsive transcriptional regulator